MPLTPATLRWIPSVLLSVSLLVAACGSDSPLAPERMTPAPASAPPVAAPLPEASVDSTAAPGDVWADLDRLIGDPFLAELPAYLTDPLGASPVSEAIAAAQSPLQERDAATLRTAVEAVEAQVVAYRAAHPFAVEDAVVLDAIQNIDEVALTWIVAATLAVSPSPEAPADDSAATAPSTTEDEEG